MIDQPLIRRDRILLAVPLLLLAALLSRALVAGGRPAGWDHAVDALRFIPANPDAPEVAAAVSLLGTGWVLYPILLLLAGVRIRRGERFSVTLAPLAVLVAGQVVRMLLLSGVAGSRPDLPGARIEGPAFSSGHAMAAVLGWGLIAGQILLLRRDPPVAVRRLAVGSAVVIALAVGLSRVYLGVHWGSDVLGGWAFGAVVLAGTYRLGSGFRGTGRGVEVLARFTGWARTSRSAWALPVLAAAVSVVPLLRAGADRMKDLLVYHDAALVAVHGGDVYAVRTVFGMPFTYPPFAALAFSPLAGIPWNLTQVLWTAATLIAVVGLARVALQPAVDRIGLPLTVAALLIATSIRSDLRFGQIGVFLVLMVAVDLLRCRRGGAGVGIAAALKLTPLVILPWLVTTRCWPRFRRSAAWFAAASVAGVLMLWRSGREYLGAAAFDTSRFGANDIPGNQSLRGMLLRTGLAPHTVQLLWLALAGPITVVALHNAHRLERAGERLGAVGVLAAVSVVVSPISWVHHLVWLVLPAAGLVAAGRHRIALAWLAVLALGLPALGHQAARVAPDHGLVWALVIDAQGLTALAAALLLPLALRPAVRHRST